MRPLKLTMTAFGPYKHTEVIDFQELAENKLFVISGNTGAGKTTIFDGICFALYGTASGTDREDSKMLRSDFADDSVNTAVELLFTIKGHQYRILRQLGHVKKGNKSKTGERYEFYEIVNGSEIPCVDRQIVSEIDKKVEAIIGLTQDQFKQIVMLPQGEFRKLLTSKTENKEAILRKLFKTDSYRQLNELLKNQKSTVEADHHHIKQLRDHYVQTISTTLPERPESTLFHALKAEYINVNEVITSLTEEAVFYQQQMENDQKKYVAAYEQHSKKQTEFHEAKALNERFDELTKKEKELEELKNQAPIVAKKESQYKSAERANRIEVYENYLLELRKEEKAKATVLQTAVLANKQANNVVEQAQKDYETEKANEELRNHTHKMLERFKEQLPLVKEIDERKQTVNNIQQKKDKLFADWENINSLLTVKKQAHEKALLQIKQLENKVDVYPQKKQELFDMREKARVLRDFLKLKSELVSLEETLQKRQAAYQELKQLYEETETLWLNNQASIIASHLHDGKACPVCGSMEHPNKAIHPETTLTRAKLDTLKKQLDEKENDYRTVLVQRESKTGEIKTKQTELKTFHIEVNQAGQINEQVIFDGKQLSAEVKELENSWEDLKEHKQVTNKLIEEVNELKAKQEQIYSAYEQVKEAYNKELTIYEERIRTIPKEVRVLAVLEGKIVKTEEKLKQLEKAWEDVQAKLRHAQEEQARSATNLVHAEKQVEEANTKRKQAEEQFATELKNANFTSEAAYIEAKMTKARQEQLRIEIEQFNQKRSIVSQQVIELRASLQDKQRHDLQLLEEQLADWKQAYETALQAVNLSKEYCETATDLNANIRETSEQLSEIEAQLAIITDLYDLLRGQNEQKISFERYLQIEYLEQIIDAANERLRVLSNGQYILIRSERQESHGRQSGLALDVYDSYTGQTRDVKTLSGGEKFNASLSLALGMSDFIQSFQGNVSIDMMFIDEGFGSLDEESLHKAIDTLIDLQESGRMIGVISHVQELKNMFPAILEVEKTKAGHSKTSFFVK